VGRTVLEARFDPPARTLRILKVLSLAMALAGDGSRVEGILEEAAREGDVVLTIGAGDITKTGPELLEALGARA